MGIRSTGGFLYWLARLLGDVDAVTEWVVDWGDGTTQTFGSWGAKTHTYDDGPATHAVAVDLVDEDGTHPDAGTKEVSVDNAPPVVVIDEVLNEMGSEDLLAGLTANLAASFADPGSLDSHTATVDWGDGTTETFDPATSPVEDSHVYDAAGTYTVEVTVTHSDGGAGTDSAEVTVLGPSEATGDVAQDLNDKLQDPDLDPAAAEAIGDALEALEGQNDGTANNRAVDHLESGNLNAALVKIRKAIQQMEAAEAADPELDLSEAKTALALTAKSVAVEVVEEAEAAAGTPEEQEKVDQAKDLLDEGDFLGAVAKHQDALRKAQSVS